MIFQAIFLLHQGPGYGVGFQQEEEHDGHYVHQRSDAKLEFSPFPVSLAMRGWKGHIVLRLLLKLSQRRRREEGLEPSLGSFVFPADVEDANQGLQGNLPLR